AHWDQQKEWWNTRFKGVKTVKDKVLAFDGAARPTAPPPPAPVAAPPPPPPPPLPALEPQREEAPKDVVVVTGSLRSEIAQNAPALQLARSPALSIDDERKADGSGGDADSAGVSEGRAGKIEISPWQVDRPYIKRLDKAGKDWEAQLDKEIKDNGALPLF